MNFSINIPACSTLPLKDIEWTTDYARITEMMRDPEWRLCATLIAGIEGRKAFSLYLFAKFGTAEAAATT